MPINTVEELSAAIAEPAEYRRLITNVSDLINAKEKFPAHADPLIQPLLNNPDEFKRIIKNTDEIKELSETFHTGDQFLQRLNDPEEFNRLIINAYAEVIKDLPTLEQLGKMFPTYSEQLIQPILNDPGQFKRIIKYDSDLKYLADAFPGHDDVFKQTSIEKAVKVIMMNSKQANAYTAGATAGALASGTPQLPPEIGHHTGLFLDRKTGGRLAQTSKTAAETAEEMQNKNKSPRK